MKQNEVLLLLLRFIEDNRNEIVYVRHVVAHTADALNITKTSQNETLKFLKMLTELLEREMDKLMKHLLVIAKKWNIIDSKYHGFTLLGRQ